MNDQTRPLPQRSTPIRDDMSDAMFDCIARIARDQAGLTLPRTKKTMVQSRVVRRLRALQLASFDAYRDLVCGPDGSGEVRHLVSALTTNVSNFFRENHHFDLLRQTVLPPLLSRAARGDRVRIWSAGCSNGQEPFSIAMVLAELDSAVATRDVRILATDIDAEVLDFAGQASYPDAMLEGVPPGHLARYFQPVAGDPTCHQLTEPLRRLVSFRLLNLHQPWPMRGNFDLIFCRNVLIYFDIAAQARLLSRFHDILTPDGWLMLGHSERLPTDLAASFTRAGITALRKGGPAGQPVVSGDIHVT